MRILIWHVHGSWMTAFVSGRHTYLVPTLPDRGPDGRGRARTWTWPASVQEVAPAEIRRAGADLVVLQRPSEIDLLEEWTGLRAGRDLPAVYVEHDAPHPSPMDSRHWLADCTRIPVVHVTHFNQLMWDCGKAPTHVVEHGVPDPGYRYSGSDASLAVLINEPVRRARTVGTDLVIRFAERLPVHVYGMGADELTRVSHAFAGRTHDDLPQAEVHTRLARHRLYLHPYRWTSLGLALLEAMMLGLPVLALATTEATRAIPEAAGLASNDLAELHDRAEHWLADPESACRAGVAAREYAVAHHGLQQFLDAFDRLLER